jgi:hypothetical protein
MSKLKKYLKKLVRKDPDSGEPSVISPIPHNAAPTQLELDAAFAEKVIKLHFLALGTELRSLLERASEDEFLRPEELDAITIKLWLSLREATKITLEKLVGKAVDIPPPQSIQELAKKLGGNIE